MQLQGFLMKLRGNKKIQNRYLRIIWFVLMLIRVKKDNKKAGSKEPWIVKENSNSENGSAAGYKLKTLWLLILTITILNISIR